MSDNPNIARVAALIGERARADILTALLAGAALTATELAAAAGVTKQTVSSHLSQLLSARLIAVENQGRHRYFRLADRDVAQLLESLMGVASRSGAVRIRPGPREPALRKARVCYDHLAGELGVHLFDSLQRRWLLRARGDEWALTPRGRRFCTDIGLDVVALAQGRRALGRACLDWSARRHHLAGALGAALLQHCFARGWARRAKGSRVVSFTPAGETAFREQFSLPAAGAATGAVEGRSVAPAGGAGRVACMTPIQQLCAALSALPGVETARSRFGPGNRLAWHVAGREFAHLHSDTLLDLRLPRAIQLKLRSDPRARFRASASPWVELAFHCLQDSNDVAAWAQEAAAALRAQRS